MQKYATIEKAVGETPLQAVEAFRATRPELSGVALAYAGRLDPMASGTLLVLIGDECKRQERYHKLDKAYRFEVLFGVGSDTGDVLGLLSFGDAPRIDETAVRSIARSLSGKATSLPYPKFSSRTVSGKPLHIWALEGRLNEIEIPVATTKIHKLTLAGMELKSAEDIYDDAVRNITLLPPVTEPSKKLGEDFRREKVLADWLAFKEECAGQQFAVATLDCIASSGTYMRSLAEYIGKECGTSALARSIHRTKIGRYHRLPFGMGFWTATF